MHRNVKRAFETIDADIFNGDGIDTDPSDAREYIARWLRRMPGLAPQKPGACFCVCRCCCEGDHCGEVTEGLGPCCVRRPETAKDGGSRG